MYNKDILNALLRQFGIEQVITFCKMEAIKNDMLAKESKDPVAEFSYDRDWWKDTGTQLEREITNESL